MTINFEKICDANKMLEGNIKITPTISAKQLGNRLNCNLFLKLESLQLTSSFKARGAFISIKRNNLEYPGKGVIAMSAGNHAQAVAYHASNFNISATIVMPEQAPFAKVARTRDLGADVILKGRTLNETAVFVEKTAAKKNLILIHPYNDYDVVSGQGSIAIELLSQVPELDCLVVPIGGGGLIAGLSIAAKAINPKLRIYGVETKLFPSAYNVFNNSTLSCSGDTIADGIAVKQLGEINIPIIRDNVDDILLVDEISIENSISYLFEDERVISEGAGAAGVAAILENENIFKNKKVATIICGGNIDSRIFAGILNRQLSRDGKIAKIRIDITDEPGMLARIAKAIAKDGGNILEIHHQRMFHDVPVKKAKIDALIEAQSFLNIDEIIAGLKERGFEVSLMNERSNS